MHPYRTHTCGELRLEDDGKEVRLSGWVFRKRDHGSLLFIDLRDHYGLTQVVVQPDRPFFEKCQRIKPESVITVTGRVARRAEETVNAELPTGRVELAADEVVVESVAETLPLYIAGDTEESEDLRLRHRFLDLRRERLHGNIVLRSRIISEIRRRMIEDHGFCEYQTPILTSSSPEGARDYLVPSRVHPGRFYAPGEFYQLDVEMSFVEQEDVFTVVEDVLSGVFAKFTDHPVDATPFRRFPYREAMLKYGSDKPDLRIPIEIRDATDMFAASGFNAFRTVVEKGGVVRAIPVKGIADRPRSFFDRMVDYAREIGAKGLAYLVWDGDIVKGPIAKFMDAAELARIASRCGVAAGDVVFFMCDREAAANRISGDIRVKLGRDLDLVEPDVYRFCWVVDFPMFERDEDTGQVVFSHNPFSMPQGGLEALESVDPLDVVAYQYDIVCNGVELSSGAVRNHQPEIMLKAFEIAGYESAEVESRFPALLNAFRYGAPPHAGIAPGIDRIVMLLAGESNIREVIAFPMNQRAQDLMMGAPGDVSNRQLRELHIRLDLPKREE